jgi:hypothetical protein
MRGVMNRAPRRLSEVSYAFDVVLSDFGRTSALKLLRETSNIERALVQRILDSQHKRIVPFLDEYRRMMFCAIGDVAYIKRDLLASYADRADELPSTVLFGVGGTRISATHVEAMADVLYSPIRSAIERGYDSVRIVIPCNTMGAVESQLRNELSCRLPDVLCRTVGAEDESPILNTHESGPDLSLYSLPRVVVRHVLSGLSTAHLLVLGTELARESYAEIAQTFADGAVDIAPVTRHQQRLMDELLLASIREDSGGVAVLSDRLERDVILPMQREYGSSLVTIQASTDYDINVGTNSLRLLATQLVLDVYGSHLWEIADADDLEEVEV